MANIIHNRLTNQQVRTLKPGVYTDGGGLTLRVHESGNRNWVLRLTVRGKRRNFGLGGYPDVSLKDARAQAAMMRQIVRRGEDPGQWRQVEEPAVPTFAEAAERVIELRAPTWSSKRHATQWRESLRLHAFPRFADRPVDAISTADVLSILEPIWNTKTETAGRVRQRMTVIFDFAIAAGWRRDNPCNGALKAALPRRTRERSHHPALPYDEMGDALAAIRKAAGHANPKLGLEYLILTAARAGEVRQATWDEIDFAARAWTVPASHMKMRKRHRVPLSEGAILVLEKAQEGTGGEGLLFPSNRKPGRPLSNMAFEMLLRRAGYGHVTVHGFRASFRTWALEQTDAPWAVAEAALAHNLGGGEVMAYTRSDLFERRRALMEEWFTLVAETSNGGDRNADEPTRQDGTGGLSPRYAAMLQAHLATQRAVAKDGEEKDRGDQFTALLERARDAKEKRGELPKEVRVDLLVSMLRTDDELEQERIKALLAQLDGVELEHLEQAKIRSAFAAAARRGKPVRHLLRMYRKGRRRAPKG